MVKLLLPLAVLLTGADFSILQLYRVICIISIVGMFAVVTLFIYHVLNIARGTTMYERGKSVVTYDLGNAKENMKQVLGERWYMTLLSPFTESKLPHDGINWDELKLYSHKSK